MSIEPSSIASEEAFGSPTALVGDPAIRFWINNDPNQGLGIQSQGDIGTFSIQLGGVAVSPAGIASGESVGSNVFVGVPPTVTVTAGIASAEAFGSPSVSKGLQPPGVLSGERFGSVAVSSETTTLTFHPVNTGERFGDPAVISGITVPGIASVEVVPIPRMLENGVGPHSGISSEEAFGTPNIHRSGVGIGENLVEAWGSQGHGSFSAGDLSYTGFGGIEFSVHAIEGAGDVAQPPGYGVGSSVVSSWSMTGHSSTVTPTYSSTGVLGVSSWSTSGSGLYELPGTAATGWAIVTPSSMTGVGEVTPPDSGLDPSADNGITYQAFSTSGYGQFTINTALQGSNDFSASSVSGLGSFTILYRGYGTDVGFSDASVTGTSQFTSDSEGAGSSEVSPWSMSGTSKFRGFRFSPLARQRVAMDQPSGGTLYPFSEFDTDDVVRENITDFYIAYEGDFTLPFHIKYIYGLGSESPNSPASGFPVGVHRYDVVIEDDNGQEVLDTTESSAFHLGEWGGRLHVAEWAKDRIVARMVVHNSFKTADESDDFPEYVYPTKASLQPRTTEKVDKTLKTISVGSSEMTGELLVSAGYNIKLAATPKTVVDGQRRVTQVRIAGVPGEGLGRYPDCSELGNIYTINQTPASEAGAFFLQGDDCWRVQIPTKGLTEDELIDTEENTVFVQQNCVPCRDCDDLETLYRRKSAGWDKIKALAVRAKSLRNTYIELLGKYNDMVACRKADPIQIKTDIFCPYRLGIAVAYGNMENECVTDVKVETSIELSDSSLWSLTPDSAFHNDGKTSNLDIIGDDLVIADQVGGELIPSLQPSSPGSWVKVSGTDNTYNLDSESSGADIVLLSSISSLPESFTLSTEFTALDADSSAFIVFDHGSGSDWKYVGVTLSDDRVIVGNGNASSDPFNNVLGAFDWSSGINANQRYSLQLTVQNGMATVFLNGVHAKTVSFSVSEAINSGSVGLGTSGSVSQFHSFKLSFPPGTELPPESTQRLTQTWDSIHPRSSAVSRYEVVGDVADVSKVVEATVHVRAYVSGSLLYRKSSRPIKLKGPSPETGRCN